MPGATDEAGEESMIELASVHGHSAEFTVWSGRPWGARWIAYYDRGRIACKLHTSHLGFVKSVHPILECCPLKSCAFEKLMNYFFFFVQLRLCPLSCFNETPPEMLYKTT